MDSKVQAQIRVETDLDCRILRFGQEIGIAYVGQYTTIKLPCGRHKLSFVGLDNSADNYELVYTVENPDFEDFISVNLLSIYKERTLKEIKLKNKEEAKQKRRDWVKRNIDNTKRLLSHRQTKWYVLLICVVLLLASIFIRLGITYDGAKEGYAVIQKINFWGCGKYGYVNNYGRLVIPFKYDYAYEFSEGLAAVRLKGKWGYVDKKGKEVIPFQYDDAYSFSEGLARVRLKDKSGVYKTGFINKKGEVVIQLKYDGWCDYYEGFKGGLAIVGLNGKYGYVGKSGEEVTEVKYNYCRVVEEGLALVRLYDKCGFVNEEGKEIIPLIYDDAYSFSEGLAAVKLNDKWGFIDKMGNEVIPLQYNSVDSFSDGFALVRDSEVEKIIDKYNRVYYNGFRPFVLRRSFKNGFMPFWQSFKYGFFNKEMKIVVPPKYDEVCNFCEGLAAVRLGDKWGYINEYGIEVIPLVYDYVSPFDGGVAEVRVKDKSKLINIIGQQVYKYSLEENGRIRLRRLLEIW